MHSCWPRSDPGLLHDFDAGSVARDRSERSISRDKFRANGFGKRKIGGIVRGRVLAKVPYTRQQQQMRVANQRHIREIFECFLRPRGRDRTRALQSSQDLSDLAADASTTITARRARP